MEKRIKKSLACAGIEKFSIDTNMVSFYTPKAGDVGIFRVQEANGAYVAGTDKINISLFDQDLVMLAFGNRYATNQVEGYVPSEPVQFCHLIGRGGVVGELRSANATMRTEPASLELIGYAKNRDGQIINTIRIHELTPFAPHHIQSKVILSIGSSMDSGKTTTAAYLCGGLSRAGHSVAYIKLTGTVFPKDAKYVYDRGADYVLDFSYFGYPSTYLTPHFELLDLYCSLVRTVQHAVSPEYIVIEIADGILQKETEALLKSKAFMSTVHSVILSCGDSLGVLSGLQYLHAIDVYPFAISGLFTASDLLIREVEPSINVPVFNLQQLLEGSFVPSLTALHGFSQKAA